MDLDMIYCDCAEEPSWLVGGKCVTCNKPPAPSGSAIVAALLDDQSWAEALRLEGLILDPDEGETILKLAEGVARVLTGENLPII